MIRTCRLCGKQIDFDVPWCDHETMEESAWLDIADRLGFYSRGGTLSATEPKTELDRISEEIGFRAAQAVDEQIYNSLK